jgi:PKD repeat protein
MRGGSRRAPGRRGFRWVAHLLVALAIPVAISVAPAAPIHADGLGELPTCTSAPLALAFAAPYDTYRLLEGHTSHDWGYVFERAAWYKDHCLFVGTGYDWYTEANVSTGLAVSVSGALHVGTSTITVTSSDGYQTRPFYDYSNNGLAYSRTRHLYTDLAGSASSASLSAHKVPTDPTDINWTLTDASNPKPVDMSACAHDTTASGSRCTYTVTLPPGTPSFIGYLYFAVKEGQVDGNNFPDGHTGDYKPFEQWSPAEIPGIAIPIEYNSNEALAAAFTATEDAAQAGLVHSVSTSPADAVHTWDFGDGTAAAVGTPSVDHRYAKPGTYTVSLTVARNGETSSSTHQVVIAAPLVQVAVSAVSGLGTASVGDTVTMKVVLSASATGLGNVVVAPADLSQLLSASGGFADVVDNVAPASVTLPPGGMQQFTATFTATGIGSESFGANFGVTDAAGATTTVSGTKVITVRTRALAVTVTVSPTGMVEPEDADGPKPVTINVTAVVKNVLDTPLDNVSVDVNPTFVWTAKTPSPVPFPMSNATPATPSDQIGTLAPGQSATVTYVESALDDVLLNVQVLAIGFPTGSSTRVSGLGVAPLEVKPMYDFRFSAKPEQPYSGPNPVATPGATIDFFLGLKNLNNTKDLVIGPMTAHLTGNAVAGGGNAFPIEQAATPPACAAPWSGKLVAGSSEKSLQAKITTVDLGQGVGNFVGVGYEPAVFEQTGPQSFQQVDPARELITAGATPTTVRLEPNIVVPPYTFGDAAFGFTDASFRRLAATGQALFRAVPALLSAIPAITKYGNPFMWPYAMADRMMTYWGSLGPAERANLVNTVIGDLALAGVKSTDFAINLQNVLPAWFDEFSAAVERGDTQHMGAMLGTVTTDIGVQLLTDQALGVIAEQVALCRLSQIPKAVAETAETDLQARYLAELPEGEKALATLTEKDSKLLHSGLLANPEIAYRVYGINAQQLADLYKLAREEGILIEIRPNGGYRHDWLEKLAALKPEALKLKTVSPLDVFLGYFKEDLGSLVLKKPQSAQEFAAIYNKVAAEEGSLVADAVAAANQRVGQR